jgi:hypothetical protein
MKRQLSIIGAILFVALIVTAALYATSSNVNGTLTQFHGLNPNKCVSQTVTFTGRNASGLMQIPGAAGWGCPKQWIFHWTTAAPAADAEILYILPSKFSVGQTYGTTTVCRTEGITAGCVTGAVAEVTWYWR